VGVARYQGVIVRDDQILLIKHQEHGPGGRSYWLLPGGGREAGESAEECVRREIQEETGLTVAVVRLLWDDPAPPDRRRGPRKTYLCTILAGEAAPGYDPEPEATKVYAITAVQWLDLRSEAAWDEQVRADATTYADLLRIQALLGYRPER